MADKQIKDLTAATVMSNTDQFAIDNASSNSRKLTGAQIVSFLQGNIAELSALNEIQWNSSHDTPTHNEGLTYWDSNAHTLSLMTDVDGVVLQVGQELYIRCTNNTESDIVNGSPVAISGINGGGLPTIVLAQADTEVRSKMIGLVTSTIASGNTGFVTKFGLVRGMDTSELSTGTVWLSGDTEGALTSTKPVSPDRTVIVGQVLVSDETDGAIMVSIDETACQPELMMMSLPLRGVVDNTVNMTGEFRTIESGLTASYTDAFALSNNHLFILINSVTGSGDITITGTSLSESTAVPVASDTEVISIDSSTDQYYQSNKKWWEITNIAIGAGITAINYDLGIVGYTDLNNINFELTAYRLDMVAQGLNPSIRFRIIKVQDDGDKKMSLVEVENIAVDSGSDGNQIIDGVRTGAFDRSLNPSVDKIWANDANLCFKQSDFCTYYTSDENKFYGGNGHEGMIIRFEGAPSGGITNVDFIELRLSYIAL